MRDAFFRARRVGAEPADVRGARMAISHPLDPGRAARVALVSGRSSGRSVCEAGRVFLAEEWPALFLSCLGINIVDQGGPVSLNNTQLHELCGGGGAVEARRD
jgi:hypothetical protein